jgi:hypothetical protein
MNMAAPNHTTVEKTASRTIRADVSLVFGCCLTDPSNIASTIGRSSPLNLCLPKPECGRTNRLIVGL